MKYELSQENNTNKQMSGVLLVVLLLFTIITNYLINYGISQFTPVFSKYLFYAVTLILLFKVLFVDKSIAEKMTAYYVSKFVDILLISLIIIINEPSFSILALFYILLIVHSAIIKGSGAAKAVTILCTVSYFELLIIKILGEKTFNMDTAIMIFYQLLSIAICIAIGMLSYKITSEKEKELSNIENRLSELVEVNRQLIEANTEIKCQFGNLQTINEKATRSLAELSTLQEVSQVINSTLDIKELLNLVGDIIIGLLGVTYCTIFLKEDGPGIISVQSSNINNDIYLEALKDKVGIRMFTLVEHGQKVFDNSVDPYSYPYGMERGIQSVLFVPIINKGKTLGLILAEHTIEKGMNDQTKKFIETIANQIGLAIENAMLYNEMGKLATTDGLTKVYNRLYFQQYFTEEFSKAKNKYPLSIIMMDIDLFKRFNDTYGHDFGDEVLRSTAQLIKKSLGHNGIIARYGGEEFVMLLKNVNVDACYKIADDLRRLVENNSVEHSGKTVNVTVSMGVSECPRIASSEKDLLKTADEALYKAKADGRNCVRKGIPISR